MRLLPRDKNSVELGRDQALFDHVDAKPNARFLLPGELSAKCGQLNLKGPQADRPDRFAHRSEISNRTFRYDQMDAHVVYFQPEKSVCSQRRD